IPPEYASILDSNITFHFLDDTSTQLHTQDDSDYNIIISISLRQTMAVNVNISIVARMACSFLPTMQKHWLKRWDN
ncbi:MAG: hypothetical protein II063_01715, partial [Prevotella sp.]|nr:hypothetical protein [Prevotella sp.]